MPAGVSGDRRESSTIGFEVSHFAGESLSALDSHIHSAKVGRSTLENAALAFYRGEIEIGSSTWV
jgi:hypothetical protein